MKNGSGKSKSKTKDVTAMTKTKHREAPPVAKDDHLTFRQYEAKDVGVRRAMVGAVPDEARADPIKWAEKHIDSIAPDAAKEGEFNLKFGSDKMRYEAARDVLAMKGMTTRPKDGPTVQQAMVFQFSGPVSASGAPIMPFSNAAPLPAGTPSAPVDAAPTPVTVDATPTKDDK